MSYAQLLIKEELEYLIFRIIDVRGASGGSSGLFCSLKLYQIRVDTNLSGFLIVEAIGLQPEGLPEISALVVFRKEEAQKLEEVAPCLGTQ